MAKKTGLGKGLDALFAENTLLQNDEEEKKEELKDGEEIVRKIKVIEIEPNRDQPRKIFDNESLEELAESIKKYGVIQPIIVKQKDNYYEIVAGERRWRAAKKAGLSEMPCIVREDDERKNREIALIENIQREDLNPIEEARAIKKLMQEYGFTQETVADRIGKSRSVIANTLRLLNLYPEVIKMVENNELSVGHAKCLVVVDDVNMQLKFANSAKNNKMTVRDLEKAVKEYLNPKQKVVKTQSLELREMVSEMSKLFSTKVSILGNDNKGRIFIDYYTKDDLDRIFELLELAREKTLTLKDLQNINLRNKK